MDLMTSMCPCGSDKSFDDCCAPIISGRCDAETAEALMRSRYVAFTLANVDYLMRTWHSRYRPVRDRKKILAWAKSVKWLGLQVIATKFGLTDDDKGIVEFRAMFVEDDKMSHIHERSQFEREKGHWVYVTGVHMK